ncbi:MAG: HNH endonuclease [Nanoarchaeota archaeon]
MKICTKCKIEKNRDEFYRDKRYAGELQGQCKKCKSIYSKEYRRINQQKRAENAKLYRQCRKQKIAIYNKLYSKIHKEEISEKGKIYRQLHKKEIIQYKIKHKEESKEYQKQYGQSHKQTLTAQKRQYRQTPKGKEIERNKRQRRRAACKITDITTNWLLQLRINASNCLLCNITMTETPYLFNSKHLDHIMPLNVKGAHTMDNVRFICQTCNLTRPRDGSDLVKSEVFQEHIVRGRLYD